NGTVCCNATVTMKDYCLGRRASREQDDRNTRRCTKAAADRAGEIHTSAARQACSQPRVSGRIDRGGRNGWVGQEHAALFAEAVAGNRRIQAAFYGVEFFAAGEVSDPARETAAFVDADDVF